MRCSTWETRGGRQQALCMLPEPGCTHGEEFPPHNFATQPLEGTREGFRAGEHGRGAGRVALGSGRLGAGLAKEPGGGRRRLPGQPGAGCRCFPINNRGRAV